MLLFLKNLIFTIFVPGTVAVYVPVFVFSHGSAKLSIYALGGGTLLCVGGAIYLWCLWDFASAGHGTPAPIDPPRRLVVRGLYQFTRNPMYVGVLGVIFGWALFFAALPLAAYGACMAVLFHLFVVIYEEPHLRKTFGSDYEEYCSRTDRWLSLRQSA
jgi:protein-S-isoprenylcysteine O-methyltransferase Ste14